MIAKTCHDVLLTVRGFFGLLERKEADLTVSTASLFSSVVHNSIRVLSRSLGNV